MCKRRRCVNANTGKQVLCTPSSHVCGTLCPLFTWCSGQQCIPNTPAHGHKIFCPEDTGVLQQVNCTLQAPGTQCYASSAGIFRCHVSGSFLMAYCGKKMAAGLAAAMNSSSTQQQGDQFNHSHSSSISGQNALLRLKLRLTGRRLQQQQRPSMPAAAEAALPRQGRSLLQFSSLQGSLIMTGLKAGTSGSSTGLSGYGLQSQLSPIQGLYGQSQYQGTTGSYPSSSSNSSGGMSSFLESYYQSVTGSTYDSASDDLS
jgi:hypothetical protein